MSKDPAILFYTSDFLTGTFAFSDEQVGKYIRLICLQHQHGRISEELMSKICPTHDKLIFSKFKKSKKGEYYNVRLEEEMTRRKNYSESRRKNRLSKSKLSESCDSHMETETITEDDNTKEKGYDILYNSVAEFKGKYSKEILNEFFSYWSEPGKSGKLRWEYEKTWDTDRRLSRWVANSNKPPEKGKYFTPKTPIIKGQDKIGRKI